MPLNILTKVKDLLDLIFESHQSVTRDMCGGDPNKKSGFDLKRFNGVDIKTSRPSIIINKIERSSFYLLQGGKLLYTLIIVNLDTFNKSKDWRGIVERVFKMASIILHLPSFHIALRAHVCYRLGFVI